MPGRQGCVLRPEGRAGGGLRAPCGLGRAYLMIHIKKHQVVSDDSATQPCYSLLFLMETAPTRFQKRISKSLSPIQELGHPPPGAPPRGSPALWA